MAHFQCNALGATTVMKLAGGGEDDAAGRVVEGLTRSGIATNRRSA